MYRTDFVLILFLAGIELTTTQRILGTTIIISTNTTFTTHHLQKQQQQKHAIGDNYILIDI